MPPISKPRIVLWGIGHTNAHLIKNWRQSDFTDCELVAITDHPQATYSGMLPGVLAGQYPADAMAIDLQALLCRHHGQLIQDEVVSVDRQNRLIHLASQAQPLAYDWLVIGIGSRTQTGSLQQGNANFVVPIKPMQSLLSRIHHSWSTRRRQVTKSNRQPFRVVVVGGGAGSIEIAYCLQQRVRTRPRHPIPYLDDLLADNAQYEFHLVTQAANLGQGLSEKTQRVVRRLCERRQIRCHVQRRIVSADEGAIGDDSGWTLAADLVLWAAQAAPQPVSERLDLPKDERGFLLTHPTLQAMGDDRVFAVGDCGTIVNQPAAKAGVYAVRQGPVMLENLRRVIHGRELLSFQPQANFLKLLNCGDGTAVFEYGRWSGTSRWAWWLKHQIDTKFIRQYQV